MELALRSRSPQRGLDYQKASLFAAPARWGSRADDHKPFDIPWLPQRQLGTLVGMVIQAWVADPQEVVIIRLPFHRVARQGVVSVFQRQHILEKVDERAFARQPLLAVE